jgi:hypothetical protein
MPSDWPFVSVDMELTNLCSSKCLMCPRDAISRPKGFMQKEVFNVVSRKLVSEGSLITFSGMGDPLSHPKVFEWISEVRQNGGDAGIVVNPASLEEDSSRKLIEAGPNSITLSFPSVKREVFERLCPEVSFEDALERAHELIGFTAGKIGLRVLGIVTEINREEQDEYVRFWQSLGAPSSSMISCHGRGGNLEVPGIYESKSVGLRTGKCGLFHFHTFITWEGNVLACCHDLAGDTQIGNLVNDAVYVISERKRNIMFDYVSFPQCRKCDEPMRQYFPPQGSPPASRKERNCFFRALGHYTGRTTFTEKHI